jgi:hypothetical protein
MAKDIRVNNTFSEKLSNKLKGIPASAENKNHHQYSLLLALPEKTAYFWKQVLIAWLNVITFLSNKKLI